MSGAIVALAEIVAWLVAAGAVGVALGWLLRGTRSARISEQWESLVEAERTRRAAAEAEVEELRVGQSGAGPQDETEAAAEEDTEGDDEDVVNAAEHTPASTEEANDETSVAGPSEEHRPQVE